MKLLFLPAFYADVKESARYLRREAGDDVAEKFLQSVQKTSQSVGNIPNIGKPFVSIHPRLMGIRYVPLNRFRKYLLFYRLQTDEIEVLHVFHSARHIVELLEGEMPI